MKFINYYEDLIQKICDGKNDIDVDALAEEIHAIFIEIPKKNTAEHIQLIKDVEFAIVAWIDEKLSEKNGYNRHLQLKLYETGNAGSYFFDKLDNILSQPEDKKHYRTQHHNAVEVFYILLCLGFKGRYEGNYTSLNKYKEKCYDILFDKPYASRDVKQIDIPLKHHLFFNERFFQFIAYSMWMAGLFTAIKIYEHFLSKLNFVVF